MNSNSPPLPLTFEDHVESPLYFQKCPPLDVVKSSTAFGPRLHAHQLDAVAREQAQPFDDPTNNANHYLDDRQGDVDHHDNDDREQRTHLRRIDKFDREVDRARSRRERTERRGRRNVGRRTSRRRRSLGRTRDVESQHERGHSKRPRMLDDPRRGLDGSHVGDRTKLSVGNHLDSSRGVAHVATYSSNLRRFGAGPLHGVALASYFVLRPYVVATKWRLTRHEANGGLVRMLLVILAMFWCIFIIQVALNVFRLRRGGQAGHGGSAWLAGLIVAALPFLVSSGVSASEHSTPYSHVASTAESTSALTMVTASSHQERHHQPPSPAPLTDVATIPLALMAKRRNDLLRQQQFDHDEEHVDEVIELLRALNPQLLAQLRHLMVGPMDGVVTVPEGLAEGPVSHDNQPLVARVLGAGSPSVVAYSKEGGRLQIDASCSSDDVMATSVAMHDGRLAFTHNEAELLRALATRVLRNTLVIYLGSAEDLDDELRACCVTLAPRAQEKGKNSYDYTQPVLSESPRSTLHGDVRIELLRADPQITGLVEPFTPTLRRRCVEMVAYLALHRGEPVTGDRLRARVLSHSDVDASSRTLANTASAVRRSLGTNSKGPRLHPVSSAGLYTTHGLTSDVEMFHTLVGRARGLGEGEAAVLSQEALDLVHGEPLASALRGFEWFLAEGHIARLQRDGEWAALALHHDSIKKKRFELAFWALQQGLLIDPYSDVLLESLARVPRLREFGGDAARRAKHEPVSSSGTVAVGWSFTGFANQVSE